MEASRTVESPALSDRVREAHAQFPTGVTVITTTADGVPYGLAVNAFASVSLDPAVVLFCVAKAAQTPPPACRQIRGGEHPAPAVVKRVGIAFEIARVEELSDAYHLQPGNHDVVVAYLIEVTRSREE